MKIKFGLKPMCFLFIFVRQLKQTAMNVHFSLPSALADGKNNRIFSGFSQN